MPTPKLPEVSRSLANHPAAEALRRPVEFVGPPKPNTAAIKRPADRAEAIGRRAVALGGIAALAAFSLSGCGGNLAPASIVAAVPQVAEIADKLALIADAFERSLPAVAGVASDAKAVIADLKSTAATVATVTSAVATHPFVSRAADLIAKLAGGGAWGAIGTAAVSLLPAIMDLAGMARARVAGRAAMSPAEAETVLRRAAARS